jgi:hypothetical protein
VADTQHLSLCGARDHPESENRGWRLLINMFMNLDLTSIYPCANRDLDYLTFLAEDTMAITPSNLAEAREYVIKIAVKRHVKDGMTEEEARARVEKALDEPWCVELPSFEDL